MADRREIAHGPLGKLALILAAASLSASCAPQQTQQQRCVFIDGGAHFGESYTAFQKSNLYSRYSWDIIAIEANPKLIDRLPRVPNLTVLNKAIWVSDGTLEFHMESDTSGANSLVRDPKRDSKSMIVESFDFSPWLESNFSVDDYVILSLDIEGAEYEVLDRLLEGPDDQVSGQTVRRASSVSAGAAGPARKQAERRGQLLSERSTS